MKKVIYIISFTVFGVLIQLLLHAVIEITYIALLTRDFQKYSFGLSFEQLVIVHHIASVVLLIAGILFGFWQGRYWWKRIYTAD